ncbi:peptidyl-prolyl cis-trans isomerase CYP28, chloroplastic-like [Quercus lobata]|uniref:peptidyl-prolyl cis-trans isomerase CYP28, chloroplastic-like n=1 Tax=Quercus lobata TaxID=97700 RepID=UPI0012445D3B|nr:peptidyl-prolyl cis-trans isomerase CYP28, chloroplastic-like [Quercus lobata]
MARSLTPQPQLLLSHNHHPPPPLHLNPIITRCSLLLSNTSLSLTTTTPPPPSLASPPLDTTITDRIFMDFSLCPTTFLPNTNPTLSPDPSTPLYTESFLLGCLILGLYGHLVPLTVSNFSLCVPPLPLPYTRTPSSTKYFH